MGIQIRHKIFHVLRIVIWFSDIIASTDIKNMLENFGRFEESARELSWDYGKHSN